MVTLTKDPSPPGTDLIAGEVTTKQHNALIDRVGGEAQPTGNRAAALDATGNLVPATTTDTELGFVNGVTSAIQTQLDGKQASLGFTPENIANKNAVSGYAGLDGSSKLTGSQQVYGSTANTAAEGNDARLSDARTPLAHATSHKSGGSDPIKLSEFAAPDDNTLLDATAALHGLMPKADKSKLDAIEASATADQSDAEIETAYNNQVSIVSQAAAEAGTSTTAERWTPQRVAQAIAALESGGGGGVAQWKDPVRVATTANGTLSTAYENGDTVDGITLATGDRILLKDQTTGSENGIYTVNATGSPTRATDWDGGTEAEGAIVLSREGTANAAKAWKVDTTGTITIGTTAVVISEFGGGVAQKTFCIRMTADQTVNNSTTLVNVTDLVYAMGANEIVSFMLFPKIASGSTPDGKFKVVGPSGYQTYWGETDVTSTVKQNSNISILSTTSAVTQGYYKFNIGTMQTTGTAGNLQVQFAQNVADASDTIFKEDAILIVWVLS